MWWDVALPSFLAGMAASVACGMGALPLLLRSIDLRRHTGLAYAFAGGLMLAASVYNLILPGLTMQKEVMTLAPILAVIVGILLGAATLWRANGYLAKIGGHDERWSGWGGKTGLLIFLTMAIHSVPEGVAVGVGYASEAQHGGHLGSYIAIAIGIHNIPEGLAVAIPLRAANASIARRFLAAFLTSLPQPLAAVPAGILAWFFEPIMPILMGYAAGAMLFLVLLELIPDALHSTSPVATAWSCIYGFCLMLLLQVLL